MIKKNLDQIKKVGEFLKGLNLELNVLPQIEKAKNKKEANETLTLIFYVDAICHQTRNFEGEINGKYARGWDYLLLCFIEEFKKNPSFIKIKNTERITGKMLERILKGSGDRYYERAYLLNNSARILKRDFSGDIFKINENSGGYIRRKDGFGMIDLFRRFKAYSDPLSKKTFLFLNIAKKTGFWEIRDTENLWTPVDYHLERVSLRIGLVEVDKKLKDKLTEEKRIPQTLDLKIRSKIGESVKRASEISRIPIENLDQLLWALGRSLCLREKPLCEGISDKNCTLKLISGLSCEEKCFISHVCIAYRDQCRRKLKEANVFTIYY